MNKKIKALVALITSMSMSPVMAQNTANEKEAVERSEALLELLDKGILEVDEKTGAIHLNKEDQELLMKTIKDMGIDVKTMRTASDHVCA